MEDELIIQPEDVQILDPAEYKEDVSEHFKDVPEIAKPLLENARIVFDAIKKAIYKAPSFVAVVKAAIPNVNLQAVFTDAQKKQLAEGAAKLLIKKDGSMLATLINPKTKEFIANIPLKTVRSTPELTNSLAKLSTQMQMAEIAESIHEVQLAVEEVRVGQENDRLAIAYSCQQNLLQAMMIKNPTLKTMALLQTVSSAEEGRNKLMLSQKSNVDAIMAEPESLLGKLLSGSKPTKIKARLSEIAQSINAINLASLSEAIAYQEMGEPEAAKKSLCYYADFLSKTYLSVPGLTQRLDMIDPCPDNRWSKMLVGLDDKIRRLPSGETNMIETKEREE